MLKDKFYWILILTIVLNLLFPNLSFAEEGLNQPAVYPDLAYEFIGYDKWENFNRKIFLFNAGFNKYIIKPVNIVWTSIVPQYGIDRIDNFYTNLKYPIRLMGCLFQKDFKSSGSETLRFLTNTTIGVAGLWDPATTKFHIEPRNEGFEQVFAYHNFKKGSYLVLPVIAEGNVRDLVGKAFDAPFDPSIYAFGIGGAISAGVSLVNGSTYLQPLMKSMESYADPYQVSKQYLGLDKYIENNNLDRKDVFLEKTSSQNYIKVSNTTIPSNLKADIELNQYHPQSPSIDSIRTLLFDDKSLNDSKWSELSVWNKSFPKQIKTDSVRIDVSRPKYNYRYILQPDKNAPIAIIYPSIGENINSNQSLIQSKILYDSGYSVLILGSHFEWQFVKSMPYDYKPGFPPQDSYYLRKVTANALINLELKYSCKFNKKIIVGTSFGGLSSLFVASQEDKQNTLGISNYIAINPPIELFYALSQLDKYCEDWQKNSTDIKLTSALTTQKILDLTKDAQNPDIDKNPKPLALTDDEAKLAISFTMRQKLSDVIFTIENAPISKKSDIYQKINNMRFYDYAQKYIGSNKNESLDKLEYEASLYSISDFLKQNQNYKIYHTLDDCFVNQNQLSWLKDTTQNKSLFFSNGSHLGYLYRSEFYNEFVNDIKQIKQ